MHMQKDKQGFTLIEMLVVILIIVILIAIAVPAVAGYRQDAQETADMGAAETVFNALEAASTKFPPSESENITGAAIAQNAALDAVYSTGVITTDNMNGPFLTAVKDFLGNNFSGSFTFNIDASSGSVNWIAYRRDGSDAIAANIMLFHAQDGVTGYLNETINPATGSIYTDNSMLHK